MTPAVNGPTEREQRWAAVADEIDKWVYPLDVFGTVRPFMAEADRESATLRARVAVLEQQIAEWRGWAQELGPFALGNRMRAVLAAGVVDNPTEDEANADPFTLDDLGHPTEGSPS